MIESNGATDLTAVGSNFYLYDSTGAGPSLKYNNTAYVAGQFSGWSPISAEKTASGYLVAWKMAGADQYSIWTTNSAGNHISSVGGAGGSTAVISAETVLQQDLNSDGAIGTVTTTVTPPPPPPPPPPGGTVIESNGATDLTAVGSNFYLYDSTGMGPSLKYNGTIYAAGYFSGWSPISAEKTASGYLVAWKQTGADQYSIWTTDNTGNHVSSTVGAGSSAVVVSAETVLQQDLNNNGTIGTTTVTPPPPPPPGGTVIESNGATDLTAVGSNFYLYDSTGAGPSLKYGGTAYTAGYFSGWSPVSAEKTASGYMVAWKMAGADQYSIWTTDNTGNHISSTLGAGSSAVVISAETVLQQDLNSNGTIGSAAPPAGNAASGAAANETSLGIGGNDSFVFAANLVNNAETDVRSTSDAFEFDHEVSADAAFAWAGETAADGALAADAVNAVTASHVTFAEFNNHGFHLV